MPAAFLAGRGTRREAKHCQWSKAKTRIGMLGVLLKGDR